MSKTDPQQELNERVKAFNSEMIALLAKYKIGIGASAFLLPDGRVSARLNVFDDVKDETSEATEKVEPKLEKVD